MHSTRGSILSNAREVRRWKVRATRISRVVDPRSPRTDSQPLIEGKLTPCCSETTHPP
jgi:hypothetical protein